MSILAGLKNKFKDIETFQYGAKAPKQAKHPRDSVIALIDNSLKLLDDSGYKIKKGKKSKVPDVCYKIENGKALVKLTYSRENLKLIADDTGIRCEEGHLKDLLNELHKAVKGGELDAQLEEIKKKRSESQKAKKAAKPAKEKK